MTTSDDAPPARTDRFAVDMTGRVLLGNYRVDRKLADGGMGSIYLGEDTNLGRRVVVKVPHVRFLGEPGFRQRFRREIAELVRLEHPHIVRILAQGEVDDVPFFVLQFLGGGSLEDRLAEQALELAEQATGAGGVGGGERLVEVDRWLRAIAVTLDFVHARGTVHRDVKPANVLFDEEGHVFLSDFGVAKALEDADVDLTQDGTGIGSPKYMAPEQAVGRDLTPAADQYALAAMVYEALAGRPPHVAGSAVELLVAKQTQDAPPPSAFVSGLPAGVDACLLRALERDPGGRFSTCTAFAEALEAATTPATAPPPGRKRSLRVEVSGVAVLLLAVLAGFVLWPRDDAQERLPHVGATNETDRMRLTLLDVGTEPRTALRYRPRPGSEEVFRVVFEQRSDMDAESTAPAPAGVGPGMDVSWAMPRMTWTFALRVEDVGERGEIAARWTTRAVDLDPADDDGPRAAMETLEAFRKWHRGFAGRLRFTPNGLVRAFAFEPGEGVPAEVQKQIQEGVVGLVGSMGIPFPVQRIGLGARWEVTETRTLMGLRLTHVTNYRLVRHAGDDVEVALDVSQTASRQPWSMNEVLGDVEFTLASLHTTGSATRRGDLGHLVPAAFDHAEKSRLGFEVAEAPGVEVTLVIDSTTQVRRDSDARGIRPR